MNIKFYSKKSLSLTIFLVMIIAVSFAQPIVLTIDKAADYAIENSKTLKSAAIDLEIAKTKKNTAWNVVVPTVQVTGTMSRSTEVNNSMSAIMQMINPSYVPEEITESDHWVAVGGVSANLNLSFALIKAYQITVANYEAGLITWEQTVKQTKRDVKKMFYSLLLLQENLKLQQTMLENARQRMIQAQTSYKNGQVPELSYLQAQVAYENKLPGVIEMEQMVKQQFDMFCFVLGMPYGTQIALEGSIEPSFYSVNAEELINKHLYNRLDIKSFNKNLQILNDSLTATKLQIFTPALAVSYSFQPMLSDVTGEWFNSDSWRDNGSFSVTLAWNLTNMLPFSSNSVGMKETKKSIEKMELTYATVLQNAEIEIHTLVDKLEKSQAAIEAGLSSVELAQKAYNMTLTAFKNGTTEYLDVKDAESQLAQAKLGLMNERYTYMTGILDLEYAINSELVK